jgi:hypothetical protein
VQRADHRHHLVGRHLSRARRQVFRHAKRELGLGDAHMQRSRRQAGAVGVAELGKQAAAERLRHADMALAVGAGGRDLPADQLAAMLGGHGVLDRVALLQGLRTALLRQRLQQALFLPCRPQDVGGLAYALQLHRPAT